MIHMTQHRGLPQASDNFHGYEAKSCSRTVTLVDTIRESQNGQHGQDEALSYQLQKCSQYTKLQSRNCPNKAVTARRRKRTLQYSRYFCKVITAPNILRSHKTSLMLISPFERKHTTIHHNFPLTMFNMTETDNCLGPPSVLIGASFSISINP